MIAVLERHTTGRNLVVLFVAALGLLVAANVFSTYFYLHTGGYGLLDLAGGKNAAAVGAGHTPDGAYALITRWGQAGRHRQLVFTLSIDALVPLLTFLSLAIALLHLTRPYRATRWLRVVAFALPGAYMLCDYGENSTILAMVLAYPGRLDPVAHVGSALWVAKTVTSNLTVLAAVIAALVRLTSWLRRKISAGPAFEE